MKKILYTLTGLILIGITACKKTVLTQAGDATPGVSIKFLHTAPGTPAIDAYVNGVKITPQASVSVTNNTVVTSITTGAIYNYTGSVASYQGLFPGSNYAAVPSGSTLVKVQTSTPVPALTSAQTSAPGAVIGMVTQSTMNGSAYSVFTLGLPGSATSPLGIKVVPDVFPDAVTGKAYVRLAYMIPNGAAVDMTATTTLTGTTAAVTKTITTNTGYSNVTDFVAVDVNAVSLTNYTFQLLLTGTTTKLGTVSSAISLAPGRFYTIIGRGLAADYVVPGAGITLKASTRPTLPVSDPTTKFPEIYFNPPGITSYTNK